MSEVADWIAALGTAGATLLAAGAMALQQRDRRRALAESVTAWITVGKQSGLPMATLHVLNAGNQAVFELCARAVGSGGFTRDYWALGTLPPGQGTAIGQSERGDHMDAVDFLQLRCSFAMRVVVAGEGDLADAYLAPSEPGRHIFIG